MLARINKLKKFRETLYSLFHKRKDAIMNLLDAISSSGHQSRSVVQLSESTCFKRKYSSITDAISNGLPTADWKAISKHTFKTVFDDTAGKPPFFVIDCTPNPRPFSRKLSDRTITHQPNPAPGNKPICVGHQYSCLALSRTDAWAHNKKWIIPISMKRVSSNEKGNEVGMQQLVDHITQFGLENELVISGGDSLYGTEQCRSIAGKVNNLVHLFRVNSKRNLFCMPSVDSSEPPGRGCKKKYGSKMALSNPDTYPNPDKKGETAYVTRSGKIHKVLIEGWENMLMRGSRTYRAYEHPMTLIRIRVFNDKGDLVFKRPLWIALFGTRRNGISLISAYQYYASRYDIEHFFRFGKNKLLLSEYQTPDTAHEENWWSLCALAYNQLYLARSLAQKLPKPWERYLPEYRDTVDKQHSATPSQTQRGFDKVLEVTGSPAASCVPRGRSPGKIKGQSGAKRTEQKIIFKSKKPSKIVEKINISGFGIYGDNSNPKRIHDFIQDVYPRSNEIGFLASQFGKMGFVGFDSS